MIPDAAHQHCRPTPVDRPPRPSEGSYTTGSRQHRPGRRLVGCRFRARGSAMGHPKERHTTHTSPLMPRAGSGAAEVPAAG